MQHDEPAQFLLELTDHERLRIIDALDENTDELLIDELRDLEPWRGLVIEAPDVDAAKMLRVVSTQSANSFPVFCVFGPGARGRETLAVKHDPERVAYVARAIHRDMAIRSLIKGLRRAADDLEARIDDESDDIATIVEAVAEDCTAALPTLQTPVIAVSESAVPEPSRRAAA